MLISGPCAIESQKQAFRIAKYVKKHGATIFRGGCWKGQNRPIVNGKPAYWGMGDEAFWILNQIQHKLDIPCATEVQSVEQAKKAISYDIEYLQVGARHMQNFPLLRFLADYLNTHAGVRVILKRGLGSTVDEFIGAAEHLGGPDKVILCERGVSHFDRTEKTRWRLDFVGVAYVKQYTDYTIIIDPSHGSGDRRLVYPLSKAALQIADGLMVEVHYDPEASKTDANQTVNYDTFRKISREYRLSKNMS